MAFLSSFAQLSNGLIFYYPFNNGDDDNQASTAFSTILGLGSSPFSPTWSFTTGYPVSLDDPFFEKVSVFPNLTSGKLFISDLPPQKCEIIVYNGIGKKVMEIESGGTQSALDVTDFAQGIHYVHIKSEAHAVVVKFVKR